MADTPLRNFRCSDKLWKQLRRIAEDRGRELSLEPSKLMSSLIRVAIEQYIERYNAAKKHTKLEEDPSQGF
jgi:predicted DNA-binding ribbon-helix-helix protein